MKNYLIASLLLASPLLGDGAQQEEKQEMKEADIAKISEAFGHMLAKNLDTLGVGFDLDKVVKGLKDEVSGKKSPMSEEECVEALTSVQEAQFEKAAADNLQKAENFLSDNAKVEGVVSLEEGKLQYKIEKQGSGSEVQPHFTPLIRYTGKYLDGTVFGSSKEDELVSIDETIPGLKEGLIGMKEGEKRVIYIHPTLAYGTAGYLPPNSLLTFEVEVIKNQSPAQESLSTTTSPKMKEAHHEIASPETPEHIR